MGRGAPAAVGVSGGDIATHTPDAAPARQGDGLLRLPRSKWSLWPCACLRGAGLPAETVLELSSPVCARLAEPLPRAGGRHAVPSAAAAAGRTTRAAFDEAFEGETARIRSILRRVAGHAPFQEAVLWQNPSAFRYAVAPLSVQPGGGRDSATRKKELLVAKYLQRYCVKNETIGFFGPVGWAYFSNSVDPINIATGSRLLAERNHYFESWAIDTVARTLDRDSSLRAGRVPYLSPFVRFDGRNLLIGQRVVRELSPSERLLVAACNGTRHAQAIARDARAVPPEFPSEEDVYDVLDAWQRAGWIVWSFEGPRELRPERTLRQRIERIDDPAARSRAGAPLDAIEAAARGVAKAAGNVPALDRATAALDAIFTQVTGVRPTRRDGLIYAGRTLVYEDCRRDGYVELGAEPFSRLGRPLALVLHSARWALLELARRCDDDLRRTFDELNGGNGSPIPLGRLLARNAIFGTPLGAMSARGMHVRGLMQQRWTEILRPPAGARQIEYRSRDLRPAVHAAFPPDNTPLGPCAVSPDVLIDATGAEAIARGAYRFVLGELHFLNTLRQHLFVDHYPAQEEIWRLLDVEHPRPRVVWIDSKERGAHRAQLAVRPQDFGFMVTRDPSPLPEHRTLRVADLEVAEDAGTLVVRGRNGTPQFSSFEFFGCLRSRAEVNTFGILPPMPHRPRLTIDDLVVCREQWRLPAVDLAFATEGSDGARFIACQRWRERHGLPQFVFAKTPTEFKPTYVDLSSPIYVDLFAQFARGMQRTDPSGEITITEMLPGPSGAWLTDATGSRYSCELRIVAVHPDEHDGAPS